MLKKLSGRQLEIMNILWDEGKPMIASAIVEKKEDLQVNTVQAALRSLIKKKYIEIAEIVYSGNVLSRSYHPIVSKEEYISATCKEIEQMSSANTLLAALVEKEEDEAVLDELERMIQERKRELEKES